MTNDAGAPPPQTPGLGSAAPPPQAPGALSIAQVAELLESTCALLEAEVKALGDDECRWHPAPSGGSAGSAKPWCVNEVLGHMIEAEKRGFLGRITRTLEQDRPYEEPWDQIAVARSRGDCDRMAMSLFMEWMGIRHQSVEMVRSLRPEQLDRACVHGKVGELRVRGLLQEWVHHDRNHTKQILSNVMARVWPHMANSQQFAGE